MSNVVCRIAYGQNDESKLTDGDVDFLKKAAQANLAEIGTGKLAARQGHTPDIKQFGQIMQQDHGKTLEGLRAPAKRKGVTLPDAPDEAHHAQAKQLSEATGKDFDKAYVAHGGIADHKAARQLLEARRAGIRRSVPSQKGLAGYRASPGHGATIGGATLGLKVSTQDRDGTQIHERSASNVRFGLNRRRTSAPHQGRETKHEL